MTPIQRTTAQRIHELCVRNNFSQEQLALKVEMNPAYLGQVERGLKCPTINTLYKITEGLDISLAEFFSFDLERSKSEGKDIQLLLLTLATIPSEKKENLSKQL